MFSKIKNLVQKNKWWTALIVIALIILAIIILNKKKVSPIESVTAEKHNIIEEVSATGNVKPLSNLDLSFETGGQVSQVSVAIGDKVYKGERLASLSNSDLVAAVEQAKAGLKIAQANLSSLKNGSTPEQIAVNESQVQKASSDLIGAEINLINSIKDSYTKSDDAVRNYTDMMIQSPRSPNPTLQFQTDAQLQSNITSERATIEGLLTAWEISSENLAINSDLNSAVNTADSNLTVIQNYLQNLAFAINKLGANSSLSQTTINLWKTNVSTVRANIDLSLNNLSVAINQYQSAFSSLDVAKSQLTLTKTGATSDQLLVQEATVEQAQANLDAMESKLDKSIITSPINGVVTNVNAKIGQIMQPGISAVSVISFGEYDVESYIPEADIAKIKIGDTATTTLDAYGSDTFFPTSVIKIDPGETIIESVPTYKVTLKFASSSDSRIKSGMTANLDILTGQANGVLAVPSRSVYSIDVKKYVQLINPTDPTKTIETEIETGMKGIDGYVEIISGLKDGDKIAASTNI